jgi:hypothetical protein
MIATRRPTKGPAMRPLRTVLACFLLAAPAAAEPAPAAGAPCGLLTAEEVAEVQGSAVVEAQGGELVRGELAVARCFYRAADYARSVSLEVVGRDPARDGGPDPASRWRSLFHGEGSPDGAGAAEEAEEEEGGGWRLHPQGAAAAPETTADARPEAQPVAGLGDEAFWVGTAVYGALYVLEGEAYLRLSLGGPGELAEKLERARRLAARVLPRLTAGP